MRVTAFVTLILIATTLSGCSHRRGVQRTSTTRICKCVQCGDAQRQMMASKTVPAEHFGNEYQNGQDEPIDGDALTISEELLLLPSPTLLNTDSHCESQYFASPPIVDEPSNTAELRAPMLQLVPNYPAINDSASPAAPEIPSEAIESVPAEPTSPQLDPPQLPAEELGKTEAAVDELVLPKRKSESVSFGMETAPTSPGSSPFQQPVARTSPNREVVRPAKVDLPAKPLPDRQDKSILFLKRVPLIDPPKSPTKQPLAINSVGDTAVTAADDLAVISHNLQHARQPIVVLQARPVAGMMNLKFAQKPDPGLAFDSAPDPTPMPVPISITDLEPSNRITNNSTVDPVYGLPLTDDVHFGALPQILSISKNVSTAPLALAKDANQKSKDTPRSTADKLDLQNEIDCSQNHTHVHFHKAPNTKLAPADQRQSVCDSCWIDGKAVQVVYRDEEGRVIMAPPTKEDSSETSTTSPRQPSGDRQTYYIPPQRILRLKATTPIGQPKTDPSVASIVMRDTVTVGGTHLLSSPVQHGKNGMPLNIDPLIEQNRVIIDHEQLREALQRLAPTSHSSQEIKR